MYKRPRLIDDPNSLLYKFLRLIKDLEYTFRIIAIGMVLALNIFFIWIVIKGQPAYLYLIDPISFIVCSIIIPIWVNAILIYNIKNVMNFIGKHYYNNKVLWVIFAMVIMYVISMVISLIFFLNFLVG